MSRELPTARPNPTFPLNGPRSGEAPETAERPTDRRACRQSQRHRRRRRVAVDLDPSAGRPLRVLRPLPPSPPAALSAVRARPSCASPAARPDTRPPTAPSGAPMGLLWHHVPLVVPSIALRLLHPRMASVRVGRGGARERVGARRPREPRRRVRRPGGVGASGEPRRGVWRVRGGGGPGRGWGVWRGERFGGRRPGRGRSYQCGGALDGGGVGSGWGRSEAGWWLSASTMGRGERGRGGGANRGGGVSGGGGRCCAKRRV